MLDVTKINVAGVTNPNQNADGSQTSTLENLEANIINELGLQKDASTGEVAITAPPIVPEVLPAAVEPKVEEKIDAEATARTTRINQENANLRATLLKLGVDPDSDTADQLRSGLITVDELMRAKIQPAQMIQPARVETVTPIVPLDQKLINLQNALTNQKGDVSAEEYRKTQVQMIEVITDLVKTNQNINQVQESNALQILLDRTISATKEVYSSSVKSKVPNDVKDIGESLFIGATDVEAGILARQIGRERAFTPEGYRHVATKIVPKFDKFVQSVYKAGAQAAVDAINKGKTGNQKVINPLIPGGGGAPSAPPANPNQFTMENLDANVDAYLVGTEVKI